MLNSKTWNFLASMYILIKIIFDFKKLCFIKKWKIKIRKSASTSKQIIGVATYV